MRTAAWLSSDEDPGLSVGVTFSVFVTQRIVCSSGAWKIRTNHYCEQLEWIRTLHDPFWSRNHSAGVAVMAKLHVQYRCWVKGCPSFQPSFHQKVFLYRVLNVSASGKSDHLHTFLTNFRGCPVNSQELLESILFMPETNSCPCLALIQGIPDLAPTGSGDHRFRPCLAKKAMFCA